MLPVFLRFNRHILSLTMAALLYMMQDPPRIGVQPSSRPRVTPAPVCLTRQCISASLRREADRRDTNRSRSPNRA